MIAGVKGSAVLSALLILLPWDAWAADDMAGAVRELARRTAAFAGRGEPVSVSWRNLSPLNSGDFRQVRSAFDAALREAGARVSEKEDRPGGLSYVDARLTVSGNSSQFLLVEEARVWALNVGDSRCYRLRQGRLEQLTLDHSLVEEQVRVGRMSPHEALRSPLRNVITRALGTQSSVTPDCFQFEAQAGDLFLLCSDGLTRELPDATIQSLLLSDISLEERSASLVEAANKAGGRDNITCILVQAVA